MPTLTEIPLSHSTHGRGIKVTVSTIASGVSCHTAFASTGDGSGDKVFIGCFNSGAAENTLILAWGGTTDPDDLIKHDIPAGEFHTVVPGLLLRNALLIRAACKTVNELVIFGYVMRAQG